MTWEIQILRNSWSSGYSYVKKKKKKDTGLKVVLLMVRSEISSTLGLKIANWEAPARRGRRVSQGESWTSLEKKDSFDENARPNVNPSFFWTVVSKQGSKTVFWSSPKAIMFTVAIIINSTSTFLVRMVTGLWEWKFTLPPFIPPHLISRINNSITVKSDFQWSNINYQQINTYFKGSLIHDPKNQKSL